MADKPGFKTSEFWLSLAATLVGLFMASGILPSEHMAMKVAGFAAAALATAGYSYARGKVKSAAPAIKTPAWAEDDKPTEPEG